jgi:DNA-directed RNA polymerase specialized sigma24 family protein
MTALRRLPEYIRSPGASFTLWLVGLTRQSYVDIVRELRTRRRDADREVGLSSSFALFLQVGSAC